MSCVWASDSECEENVDFYQEGSPCTQQGAFKPHPTDCGKFLMCNNEAYIERPCGGGLHWDQKISACNFPKEAQCQPGSDSGAAS